ncbi:MAG: DUF4097 family beta strand repeat-containing protein [bacterium]
MLRRIVAFAALAVLATGCLYYYKLEVPSERNWQADITSARFRTLNGSVDVLIGTDTTTTALVTRRCFGRSRGDAEGHIDDIVITDTVADRRLDFLVTAPTGPRNYGADLDITLAPAAALELHTSNGAVSIVGVRSGIAARSSNGRLELTGTAGTADLNTSNGAVTVAVHTGSITISTSNGEVACDLALLDATGHCRIETSNDNVTLRLPADVSAGFDLETSNGDITIVPGFGSIEYTLQERTRKTGSLGSGAAALTIKTSNGNITVRPR